MRLRFLRLECDIDLDQGNVSTLRVADRALFARIVESVLSEQGEYAKEPYLLFDDGDKAVSPRKRMIVIHTLPEVPLNNRTLIGKLYKRLEEASEIDLNLHDAIQTLSAKLNEAIDNASGFLRGEYGLSAWNLESYLKAFSLSPSSGAGFSLLDNCISLFELIADVAPEMALIMVNARSFFSLEELKEILEQSVFLGIRLMILEATSSDETLNMENITTIDQQFCVI